MWPGLEARDRVAGPGQHRPTQEGASKTGTSCNLELVGQHQGKGASWVSPTYKHCTYTPSSFPASFTDGDPGVHVIDASDPRRPFRSATLKSPAMMFGPWESLKVNEKRGLLGGVAVGPVVAGGLFSVYDIKDDCAHPKLLNGVGDSDLTLPANALAHEGGWSPDGRTYWSTGLVPGSLTAIDVDNPKAPRIFWTGIVTAVGDHGFSFSDDGSRMYLSTIPGGVNIYDVSDIQTRKAGATVRQISGAQWDDGLISQVTVPITKAGKPLLISIDEIGNVARSGGAVRFVDISNERDPKVVSTLRLAIQLPKNVAASTADLDGNGLFHYDAHYCTVDRPKDPTALACGYFNSGIRVFDIRDIANPKEIAYYNPGAQTGKNGDLPDSEHAAGLAGLLPTLDQAISGSLNGLVDGIAGRAGSIASGRPVSTLTADWCSSPPVFHGSDELWATCQDNGFLALKFKNGAYPLNPTAAPAACTSRRKILRRFRKVPTGARITRLRATANGRRITVRKVGRRTVRVTLVGLARGKYKVRVTGRLSTTRRTVTTTSTLRTCGVGRTS